MAVNPWKRSRRCKDACTTYLKGKSRKPHKLRTDLQRGLSDDTTSHSDARNDTSTRMSPCTTCDPVLKQLKLHFDSLVRQGLDLRKRKRKLPRKPNKLHYRNLVAQNKWIRSNLFDALGNYKYCQRCITLILKIGTQRLAHQRTVKQRQAHAPLVHMTKSEVLVDHLEE